jgi:hypothetical protein
MLPEGVGYHAVRVQYLDGAGNRSAAYSDYIKLLAPDAHVGAIDNDKDGDYLADAEEQALETDPAVGDENRNSSPDGMDLALQLSASILKMPWFESAGSPESGLNPADLAKQFPTDQPYVIHFDYPVFCVWTCPVCHESVHVGELRIVNPAIHASWSDGFQVLISAWHYLQHGSFSYGGTDCGDATKYRLDVPGLFHAVIATSANIKAAQWMTCGTQPKQWGVEILPWDVAVNAILVSGPTASYGRECDGAADLGGRPFFAINEAKHILTLVGVDPVAKDCPLLFAPICGLQATILGMTSGKWTFRAPILDPSVEFAFEI